MSRVVLACVRRVEGLLVVAAVALSSCGASDATQPGPREPESTPAARTSTPEPRGSKPAARSYQHGLATYYADSLAGNKTASGERYDPKQMTAAHRSLPFGTVVEVARKDGRKVRVRINDRGPFGSKKRIIDLSRRAAEELGMVKDGVVSVTITIVE